MCWVASYPVAVLVAIRFPDWRGFLLTAVAVWPIQRRVRRWATADSDLAPFGWALSIHTAGHVRHVVDRRLDLRLDAHDRAAAVSEAIGLLAGEYRRLDAQLALPV
jgi:hypothetical protein